MDAELTELVKATAILAAGIFLVMRVLHQMKWISKSKWYARFAPMLPPTLGIAGAFGGGIAFEQQQTIVVTIIYGLVAAYSSEKAHKVLGQTILGEDKRIKGSKK